ncbi:universal stress protein [Cupriavidus sp. 2TAF22]|uniref:universal stress protein n=1 Tax=unclassified Cupriavidus TaxID=2640874 RepID=UPI003F9384EB
MFQHILLPIDGSPLSQKAVAAAIEFARATGARLTAYMCVEEYPFLQSSDAGHEKRSVFEQRVEAAARSDLARVEAAAALAGVPCAAVTSVSAAPYRGIIATATEQGCDVIFMASHGRSGISGLLIGSETQKVLTHSTIPVLVFR